MSKKDTSNYSITHQLLYFILVEKVFSNVFCVGLDVLLERIHTDASVAESMRLPLFFPSTLPHIFNKEEIIFKNRETFMDVFWDENTHGTLICSLSG